MRPLFAALAALALVCAAPAFAEPVPIDMAAPVVAVAASAAPPAAPPAVHAAPAIVVAAHAVASFVEANPGWALMAIILALVLVANGIQRYPRAAGIVRYLHMAIDLLSPFVRADSPGTFKPPLVSYDQARGFILSLSQPPGSPVAAPSGVAAASLRVLPLLLATGLLGACASSPTDAARQALAAAERVSTGGVSALEQYDLIQQQAIVDAAVKACAGVADRTACIEEKGKAPIAAYRVKRATVVKALVDEQAVIGVGASLIPLVEAGIKKSTDLDAWISQLLAAGIAVKDALAAFGVSLPGGI